MRNIQESREFFDWLKSHELDVEECTYVLKWTEAGLSLAEALSDIMNFRSVNKQYEHIDWGNPITP